jgi:endonuclease-3
MLSSQTKDEVTSAAIQNLRAFFGGHLTLDAVLDAKEEDIGQAISKVGFWRRKAG